MCTRRTNVAIRATPWIPLVVGALVACVAAAGPHAADPRDAAANAAAGAWASTSAGAHPALEMPPAPRRATAGMPAAAVGDPVENGHPAAGTAAGSSLHDAARSGTIPASDSLAGSAQIVVYKSKRKLALYRNGIFEKEYRIVLGLQPDGRKRHEHDARTPEGRYRIVGRHAHARWQYFLVLDYPNAEDQRRYAAEIRAGTIADEDGAPFAIGDGIGIHGSDRPEDQAVGKDWTKGCIAMSAGGIEELANAVPVGTTVWIVQ